MSRTLTRPAATFLALTLLAPTLATPCRALAQSRGATAAPAPAPRADLVARGQQLFEDQQYEESIQILSAALLRPNNTKAQKIEIYRLLALNYITLNRKEESESAVRGLLAAEPEYALPPAESPRFRDFFAATKARWEQDGRPGLIVAEAPPPPPAGMRHTSPSQAERSTQIEIVAHLDDAGHRVERVELFFRSGTRGPFERAPAAIDTARGVRAAIPPSAVKPPLVEYYLQGLDKGGLAVVSRGDSSAPLRVAVPEPKGSRWVLPVAIGGAVVGAAAIVLGSLALGGVFSTTPTQPQPAPPGQGTVSVSILE